MSFKFKRVCGNSDILWLFCLFQHVVNSRDQSSLLNLNEHTEAKSVTVGWSSFITLRWDLSVSDSINPNLIKRLKWSFCVNVIYLDICQQQHSKKSYANCKIVYPTHTNIMCVCFRWLCVLSPCVNYNSALNEQTDIKQQEALWLTFWMYGSVWMTSVTLWKITPAASARYL